MNKETLFLFLILSQYSIEINAFINRDLNKISLSK